MEPRGDTTRFRTRSSHQIIDLTRQNSPGFRGPQGSEPLRSKPAWGSVRPRLEFRRDGLSQFCAQHQPGWSWTKWLTTLETRVSARQTYSVDPLLIHCKSLVLRAASPPEQSGVRISPGAPGFLLLAGLLPVDLRADCERGRRILPVFKLLFFFQEVFTFDQCALDRKC